MNVKVTRTKVIVENGYIVNKNEYKVNPLEFEFSEDYTPELVKKAVFVANGIDDIEKAIINNQCDIPYDVLDSEQFELHVYAYEVASSELILRYSPTYAKVFLREGSYRGVTGSGEVIEPTQFEQYEQALQDGLLEMSGGLAEVANVDIDVSKSGTTTTVTITDRNGTEKSENIEDGTDYVITQQDYQEIADIVRGEISIPTKTSQLINDSGYITNNVNDLTNYYKKAETYNKTEIDNKVTSVYRYKGSVATYNDLPSAGLTVGDVYNVESNGSNYAWNGTTWDNLGGDVDLSNYYTKSQADTLLGGKVDKIAGKGLSENDYTTTEKTKLAGLSNYDDTQVKSDIGTLSSLTTTVKTDLVSAVNEVNGKIGDVNSLLDEINGEVI